MNLKLLATSAVIAAAMSGAAYAQVTVGVADTGNCFPFSCNDSGMSSGPSIDYFQIYSSTAFAKPITFNEISFQDGGFGGSGDIIGGTYGITFSTTTAPLGSSYPVTPLSNTEGFFDQTLAASSSTSGLSFSGAAYTYDPAAGNLVMEVTVSDQDNVPNGSGNSYLAADDTGISSTRAYTISGDEANDSVGLVTTFKSVSAAPEPSTWALMILGLGTVGLMLRRAQKTIGLKLRGTLVA